MREINMGLASKFTSPNPLVLICTQKGDGSTNLATVSFFTYLSFKPNMLGFAMHKDSYTGQILRATKEVAIAVPGESLASIVISCGTTSGANVNKAEEFNIPLQFVPDSAIRIPVDSKVAFYAKVSNYIETGDHYFYICNVDKVLGDENAEALFAWGGYSSIAPAERKISFTN